MEKSLLETIDNFREFLFVNELDKELVRTTGKENLFVIGKSKGGYRILCAKIGSGRQNALIFGFPHPNEPVGSLTCLSLIKIILENKKLQKRFTWYIIPCADPDGAKLNENWFKGKFSIRKYVNNFYRSRARLQTDWSFPVEYKDYKFSDSPQNVVALRKLIEKTKPSLVYPLHNAGFSGAYFFVTKPMPKKYYDELIGLCKFLNIPLHLGEPEVQFMKELKKPIYLDFFFEDEYDYYESLGKDPKEILDCGTNSRGFARKLNPNLFGLVGEIPYIYDSKITDNSPTKRTRRENLYEAIKVNEDVLFFIENIISHEKINKNSIFYDLLKRKVENGRKLIEVEKANLKKRKYNKIATIAEEFSALVIERFYVSLTLGELRRLLLESVKSGEIKKLIKKTEKKIDEIVSFIENNSEYRALPIRRLVQLQLGCLLISLDYL